ncbi:MAG: sigma factor-like helix-turn-helix DNA-binding protein [Dehalococcoidales bacterium]|nr:sigma factor-like helix-turn-helix DNA-binding protein [Dehalococcoidales bacterium]
MSTVPESTDNQSVLLEPVSLRDTLLDEDLIQGLESLGLERTIDLWVLAAGNLCIQNHDFSYLLGRISQHFAEDGGIWRYSPYHDEIKSFSQLDFTNIASMFDLQSIERVSETNDVKVSLSIQVNPHITVYWEACMAGSLMTQDLDASAYDRMSKMDFCLYLLRKAANGDIHIRHWAYPAMSHWQDLQGTPTSDLFTDWLYVKKLGQRDLKIFEDRMGLISGSRKTLEEVGYNYKITRERVRQITSRFLKSLCHPTRRRKLEPFRVYIKKLFQQNGSIMSLREISKSQILIHALEGFSTAAAAELVLHGCGIFKAFEYDFSSIRGDSDIESITWYLDSIHPSEIHRSREEADSLINRELNKYNFMELVKEVSAVTGVNIETVKASLRTYNLTEQDQQGFVVRAGKPKYLTVPAMALQVLRDAGVPLHFTAITENINNLFPERNLKPNYVLNSLCGPIFRWVDRGAYGLAEWGLPEIKPKENYSSEKKTFRLALKEIGQPATIPEILQNLNEAPTEIDSLKFLSKPSIILHSNPRIFVSIGYGKWGLVEWGLPPVPKRDTIELACEVLAEDSGGWLTIQDLYMEMKSRRWPGVFGSLQNAIVYKEVKKPNRRIRGEELHGFNITLYGLSTRIWNEQLALERLLSD